MVILCSHYDIAQAMRVVWIAVEIECTAWWVPYHCWKCGWEVAQSNSINRATRQFHDHSDKLALASLPVCLAPVTSTCTYHQVCTPFFGPFQDRAEVAATLERSWQPLSCWSI
jgi:hypothetical protein